MKRILLETLVIVVVAGFIGTAVHPFRDGQKRIPLVKQYPAYLPIRPCPDVPEVAAGSVGGSPLPTGGETSLPAPDPNVPNPKVNTEDGGNPDPVANSTGDGPEASRPPVEEEPETSPKPGPGSQDGPVREIDLEEAYEWFQTGAVFVDARRTKHFEAGHIRGAHSLPYWEGDFDEKFGRFTDSPDVALEMPIVVYCIGEKCEDSHHLTERLEGAGFQNIMIFLGGFPLWKKMNYPTETGPDTHYEN